MAVCVCVCMFVLALCFVFLGLFLFMFMFMLISRSLYINIKPPPVNLPNRAHQLVRNGRRAKLRKPRTEEGKDNNDKDGR